MVSDIMIVTQVLQERASLKPSPRRAKEALEAFQRLMQGCSDEDLGAGDALIRQARQHIESRMNTT